MVVPEGVVPPLVAVEPPVLVPPPFVLLWSVVPAVSVVC